MGALASRFLPRVAFRLALAMVAGRADLAGAQNVVIAVIDGMRNEEAFEDASHQYIPGIWEELRPKGMLLGELYNEFGTASTAAYTTMLTGRWDMSLNAFKDGERNDVRPTAPTLFECFRRQLGVSREAGLIVSGNIELMNLDYSLHPLHGPGYDVPMILLPHRQDGDTGVFDALQARLSADHPRLTLVVFQDVDAAAHHLGPRGYHAALRGADKLVVRIWKELIEGDPVYRGNTTLVVTADHGRHDYLQGGPGAHYGSCHGCRHLPFLVLGPNTPVGGTSDRPRFQIDLAPTIAEILGFSMPFAEGQIVDEILGREPKPARLAEGGPAVALRAGEAFLVWAAAHPDGKRVLWSRGSPSDGRFGPAAPVDRGSSRWAYAPSVIADQRGVHVAWMERPAAPSPASCPPDTLRYRNLRQEGGEEHVVWTGGTDPRPQTLVAPQISSGTDGELVITAGTVGTAGRRVMSFRSSDGESWVASTIGEDSRFPGGPTLVALGGGREVSAWIDLRPTAGQAGYCDWEVLTASSTDGGDHWGAPAQLTSAPGPSGAPSLAWDGSNLLATWASRDPSAADWKLKLRTSADQGATWSSERTILLGPSSVWEPDVVWDASRSDFVLLLGGAAATRDRLDVAWTRSRTGAAWSRPALVVANPTAAHRKNATLAVEDGVACVAWEERDPLTGDWRVKAKLRP